MHKVSQISRFLKRPIRLVNDYVFGRICLLCPAAPGRLACSLGASVFFVIACGNCVYYAMWKKFPPISSWILIIPIWLVALAGVRTFSAARIAAVPPIYAAIPLVLAVWLFAPGTLGPLLGVWIPFCCIIGTISGLRASQPATVRRAVATLSVLTVLSLISFGVFNYVVYNQMPPKERAKYLPVWQLERHRNNDGT